MGRASIKENKNVYQLKREELGFSREKASELLECVPPERIEKIDSEKVLPHPEEVLIMADKYKSPELCNYYCSNQFPEIKMKELPQIILETVASLNKMNKKQERLIEITADGIIDNDELDDFIYIQEELEKISVNVETLQLWSERMLASGAIDEDAYNKRKLQKSNN